MSITRLGPNRYRAQVYDPMSGKNVSVRKLIGGPAVYRTKQEAKAARERARERVSPSRSRTTVSAWRDRWLTDPLFRGDRKDSTTTRDESGTEAFVSKYGDFRLDQIDDGIVAEWLRGGKRNWTVVSLKTMWQVAGSATAGRIVSVNPWAGLDLPKSKGNQDKDPPPEAQVHKLIAAAEAIHGPYFAAWLTVAAFTGMRPAELDALRRTAVDFQAGTIRVDEQFSASSRKFTSPKNGKRRVAILTPPAREALLGLPATDEFCFVGLRCDHFTANMRNKWWPRIRKAAGYDGTLYLCTRHFAGSYMVNVLGLDYEDVGVALGHKDGQLVRRLYGHRDRDASLERVRRAYESVADANVARLHVVKDAS